MNKIEELLHEGKQFTFKGNSYSVSHGIYTRASSDLLGWIARVEDFIVNTYGIDSSAYKLYLTFNRNKLNGYEQGEFDKQMNILIGALSACVGMKVTVKEKTVENHPILQLIKNFYFWTVLVIACSGSFGLASNFGTSRFDKEKIEFYEQTKIQKGEINILNKKISARDSTIHKLNSELKQYRK